MKRRVPLYLFLFFLAIGLSQGARPGFADNVVQVSSGDYELVTLQRGDEEILYRLNNKTGQTWVFEGKDVGWVKLREQQA